MTKTIVRMRGDARLSRNRSRVGNVGTDVDTVLILDIETHTDTRQRARIGGFMVKHLPSQRVLRLGQFCDDVSDTELATARSYVAEFPVRALRLLDTEPHSEASAAYAPLMTFLDAGQGMELLSKAQFLDVLYEHARAGGAIAGHNIRFDFGALINGDDWCAFDNEAQGKGFRLSLCDCADRSRTVTLEGSRRHIRRTLVNCPRHPSWIIENVGGKKSRFYLAGDVACGPVIDTLTLGRALGGPGELSLKGMGKTFRCRIRKRDTETAHGAELDAQYLDYLTTDILSSIELFERQIDAYRTFNLSTPVSHILSEASVGKAFYADLGIQSGFTTRPFYDRIAKARIGRADVHGMMEAHRNAYRGARSEVRLRLTPVPVACLDFLSQYPTVNVLMDLKSLLIAADYEVTRGPSAAQRGQRLLERIDLAWLQQPKNWPLLVALVKVDPTDCYIPIGWEAKDAAGDRRKPFGLAHIAEADGPIWLPFADVVASKIISGHMPRIIDAIHIGAGSLSETQPHTLFGRLTVNPATDNPFRQIIETRTDVKREMKKHDKGSGEHVALDAFQNMLKLLANATSYGIHAETVMRGVQEEQGRYYAPHIVCHITAGGRLLLALAEAVARDIGLRRFGTPIRYVMCDTDGVAFARPDGVSAEAFDEAIAELSAWFSVLSPYANNRDMFARDHHQNGELWFFGVSCKRYGLYTRAGDEIAYVKLSSHGTGHLSFDSSDTRYDEGEQGTDDDEGYLSVPTLLAGEKLKGIKAWQKPLWTRAIERAEGRRKPDALERAMPCGFPMEPWTQQVARTQVSISTPNVANQYHAVNTRPFAFFARLLTKDAGRKLIAHAGMDETAILATARDMATGKPVRPDVARHLCKSLHAALAEYFTRAEGKSEGTWKGRYQQAGWLERPSLSIGARKSVNRKGQSLAQAELDFAEDDAA